MGRDAWRNELFSVPFGRELFSETQLFMQPVMPVEHHFP
jgi:hypothetical protein